MTDVLPIGYVTLLEAAEMLQPSMFAGVPDEAAVTKLRQMGVNVSDGTAMNRAIAEIWKAVDSGTVRPMVVGGRPRRIIRLNSAITKQIPTLRSVRGRGFTFLRPSNPAFHQMAGWFGPDLSNVALAFRETEIRKLSRRLMRARRTAQKTEGQKKFRGRPPRIPVIQPVIRDLIARRRWKPTMGMKALTREVNRAGKWPQQVSQDTVTRSLDALHEQNRDRRFERVRHIRQPSRPD